MLFISKFTFDLVFQQQIFIPQGQPAGMPARIYQKRVQTEAYLLYNTTDYVALPTKQLQLHYVSNYVTSDRLSYLNSYPLCTTLHYLWRLLTLDFKYYIRQRKKKQQQQQNRRYLHHLHDSALFFQIQ